MTVAMPPAGIEPLISVILCSYNGRAFLPDAIADMIAQTYTNWELVISDDCSPDGTGEWLAAQALDPRIRVYRQPRNLGYVANKNAAFALARGDYLTQLDQDDSSAPDRLRLCLEGLVRHQVQIVGCGYRRIDMADACTFSVAPPADVVLHAPPADGQPYPFWFPTLMFTAALFDEVGPFDEYFAGVFGDDLYWAVRANQRFPILCLAAILYDYRDTPASITSLLDNPRKLIMGEVLRHLISERIATGSDRLEIGGAAAMARLEQELLADRALLAAQYQLYAARSIDQRRWAEARRLMALSFRERPWHPSLLRTIVYYARARRASRRSTFAFTHKSLR
jgi:glycosyltransferase involved in cell wall biosynthesis